MLPRHSRMGYGEIYVGGSADDKWSRITQRNQLIARTHGQTGHIVVPPDPISLEGEYSTRSPAPATPTLVKKPR